jgi:uncharacterized membrane protein YeaQ/YmgE (transglycosylase-associated protein family)
MVSYYFNIGLVYFIVGFGVALVGYFVFKRDVIGHFIGALVVGLVGSFLGGAIGYLFDDVIAFLTNINNSINIFPPLITSAILLWIFIKVSAYYRQ